MPVAEEEELQYIHQAIQQTEGELEGSDEENRLLIIFKFFKLRIRRRYRGGPDLYDTNVRLGREEMWACFSDFKDQVSPSNPNGDTKEYEHQIVQCLSSLSVPESEHRHVIENVFRMVEAAETAQFPVVVGVWEANRICRIGPYTRPVGGRRVGLKVTPAATSAIEGLESLAQVDESIIRQMPSCSVCLEDFDVLDQQQPMTKLPCRHHFHLHCIAECLEISNLCPLCRYAMPTQED